MGRRSRAPIARVCRVFSYEPDCYRSATRPFFVRDQVQTMLDFATYSARATPSRLVRIAAALFSSRMLLPRQALLPLLALAAALPAAAQGPAPQGLGSFAPLRPLDNAPDHLKRYNDCMILARSEPLKALPVAEKWHGEGGGLAARHCVAVAMFESGRYVQAGGAFEGDAR